jgi:hypothetical protein
MKSFLHLRVRIHHWVLWWMVLGVVCGVVAVTNILERNLSRAQERILLALGVLNWILGGFVCYACEGIQIHEHTDEHPKVESKRTSDQQPEWHAASDFLLPGGRKSLLPPRYR